MHIINPNNGNGQGEYEPTAFYEHLDTDRWVEFSDEGVDIVYGLEGEILDEEDDEEAEQN